VHFGAKSYRNWKKHLPSSNFHLPAFTYFRLMYVLKIKGTAKIPDYVQMRDDSFSLIAYFRLDRPEKALMKNGFGDRQAQIMEFINNMPFGKVLKLEL